MSVHIERLPLFSGGGRHIEHDDRSRDHAVELEELFAPRSVLWNRYADIFDQGQLGSCTGNAITGALACAPFCGSRADAARYDEAYAVDVYSAATRIDHVPGEYPPDDTGSSGLAVAKVVKREGLISRYGHAFTTLGLLHAIQHQPLIVGVSWFEGFDQPDEYGRVTIAGQVRGGHEIVVRGYEHGQNDRDSYLFLDNSWGPQWGDAGSFRMSVYTWSQLREQGADAVVPKR